MKLHCHFFEYLDVSNYHADDLFKSVSIAVFTRFSFKNEKLIRQGLVLNVFFAANYSQVLLILALLDGQDLRNFPCLRCKELNWKLIDLLKRLCAEKRDLIPHCNNKKVHGHQLKQMCSFQVLSINRYLKILLILTSIYIKASLIRLISHTKLNSLAKHGLIAIHVIVHHIFELGEQGAGIDEIEVNLVICCDLNSNVSFDEEQKALVRQRME
jgi:hypothetical protein